MSDFRSTFTGLYLTREVLGRLACHLSLGAKQAGVDQIFSTVYSANLLEKQSPYMAGFPDNSNPGGTTGHPTRDDYLEESLLPVKNIV